MKVLPDRPAGNRFVARGPGYVAMMNDESLFYQRVSEEADLPEADARTLVENFLSAISGYVGEDALTVLKDLAPSSANFEQRKRSGDEHSTSIEDLLLEISDEESVETGQAGLHARVVAETLSHRADPSQLQRLTEAIEDEEILALFERVRGELTQGEADPGVRGE